MSDFF